MRTSRRQVRVGVLLVLVLLTAQAVSAQAILGTTGGSGNAVVFPTPDVGLPNPTQINVSGLPAGASAHGVSYYGSDNALVTNFGASQLFVVQISTASLVDTIPTAPFNATGTIAVAPGLNFALGCGGSSTMVVIAAPFGAGSTITTVPLPGSIQTYQTQGIVFNAAGRAFVYHTTGISVLDPPYSSIAFTIPAANGSSGAIAITPDGNTLLVTNLASGNVDIFSAPFSAGSTPVTLTILGSSTLDGIMATPDGSRALVVSAFDGLQFWSIAAPYSASSVVDTIPLPVGFGIGFEDVGISADGQLAIFAGQSGSATAPFVQAPFTTVGATPHSVGIPGGRGAGAVRFLPPGLAPGLTISKSAPGTVPSGSNLTYTITYGNTGAADATGVIIQDTVPAGTSFVSATGGGTFAAGVVTWNIGTVMAGSTGLTVSFTVLVTATSGTVDNVNYTIAGAGIPPIPGPPVFTVIGGGGPTPTPTPPVGPTADVPMLSGPMLALLALALAAIAVLVIRRI